MRRLVVAGLVAASLAAGAVGGNLLPRPEAPVRACATEDDPGPCHWDAQTQGNGLGRSFDSAPYCMVERDQPAFLTVVGPAGGTVSVDGRSAGRLVAIAGQYSDEVRPDADPYGAILYNVAGGEDVRVDDFPCETT